MVETDERVPVGIVELKEREIDELNEVVKTLVVGYLLDATFSSKPSEKVHFPGERDVSHYEMTFALDGVGLSSIERERYGKNAIPGIRVVKRLQGAYMHRQEGVWNVEFHRVIFGSQRVVNGYETPEKLRADLETGEMVYFRNGVLIDDPREIKSEKKKILRKLRKGGKRLVDSKFLIREIGKWYELNKQGITLSPGK